MSGAPEVVFAERVRSERRRAGLSQAEFAERLSRHLGSAFDKSAFARVERNDRGIRLDEAVAIAEVLGVRLEELLSNESATQFQLRMLRTERGQQESRANVADHEYHQALEALAELDRKIEELEASLAG